ncbi:endonuclease III [Denitrovibrio acetiphilus DSM 12809]|uniref:Endonuclease III n=1 Tax=Denitrovibrio acetiphilus (strain DSM 12809 / NBRC 114555 / N2460) TaxID=522772 RepID=D4H5M3_DENA2|nr:endonuclease III [Denitrovibrio acetiphilus]ADD69464.1 endonuclease III [Denitrovibrio acetiphilus DSM 12809]
MTKQERAEAFEKYLEEKYPVVVCSLNYQTPFQLLTATILSAQCTDARVNIVTKDLFAAYPDPFSLADADIEDVAKIIKSTGMYKMKSKNIIGMAKALVENHGGEVPQDMDELLALSGVGRKTANVVRGNFWQKPGVVVDTHVKRISGRVGLTDNTTPEKVEKDLEKLIKGEKQCDWCHRVIYFGREICTARSPKCGICGVSHVCKYYASL